MSVAETRPDNSDIILFLSHYNQEFSNKIGPAEGGGTSGWKAYDSFLVGGGGRSLP